MTQETLCKYLKYCPQTGEFIWINSSHTNALSEGQKAGSLDKSNGYIKISLLGKRYYAHRLAFLYMWNSIPEQVDHINGDRADNRWRNLKPSSKKLNPKNSCMKGSNTSGQSGVYYNKRDSVWVGEVTYDGVKYRLGSSKDFREISKTVQNFYKEKGFSERHGKKY